MRNMLDWMQSLKTQSQLKVTFGNIKGLFGELLEEDVTNVIANVGLVEKTHALASALSGGMKRKLCLAIALVSAPAFSIILSSHH